MVGDGKKRCAWAENVCPVYRAYHDEEWGVPVHDDGKLYEMFLLETFQAGLSWLTILRKREAFRAAFDSFDPERVAGYGEEKIAALLKDSGIIRCRRKIEGAVKNAGVFLAIQLEYGSFDRYLRAFAGDTPIVNTSSVPPVTTPLSDALSRDLKARGMRYVGSVTIYSFLQAVGVVNDHETDCFCHPK